jgi:hypothetical protein
MVACQNGRGRASSFITDEQTGAGTSFVNLNHTGSGTLQLTSGLTVTGTFTNSAGIFDANDQAMTVTGPATVTGGTYLAGMGAPQRLQLSHRHRSHAPHVAEALARDSRTRPTWKSRA